MNPTYFLGVDGGGTKTLALIADADGRIVGAARGPGSNWTEEDPSVPMAVVVDVARDALAAAGLAGDEIGLGVFALAGADWPEDHTRREVILGKADLARDLRVKNDSFAGLRAGTRERYGVVILAGTERNAAVIAPDGREIALGYYATYGGAKTIAAEALDAVVRAEAGLGPPTALTAIVLELLGFDTVEGMFRAALGGRIPEADRLRLCPPVFEAAAASDAVAAGILIKQAQALSGYAIALARRCGMLELAFDVVLSGSVFKGVGPLLIETITREIARVAPRARVVRTAFEPVVGSLLLAYDAAGIDVTGAILENVAATLPGAPFFDTQDGRGYRPMQRLSRI